MIKLASSVDRDNIKQLWAEAFGTSEPYFSWYFSTVYQDQLTFCLYQDDQLACSIQYAPYQLNLHGQTQQVAYLVGVATKKEYQHQGLASQLMRHVISALAPQYRLLLLYTDIPSFYQPFGFSHCYQLQRYQIPAAASTTIPKGWQQFSAIEVELAPLKRIYQQMTSQLDGYILRNDINWRNYLSDFLSDGGGLYLRDDAYLLWFIDEDQQPKIKEIGYCDSASLNEALTLAAVIAAQQNLAAIPWAAPSLLNLPAYPSSPLPHVMALDTAARGTAKQLAQATQQLFGQGKNLWVNEIT